MPMNDHLFQALVIPSGARNLLFSRPAKRADLSTHKWSGPIKNSGVNILDSLLLPVSVISTDSEGAKRPKGSGEIPRMRPLSCRYEVFSPSCRGYTSVSHWAFGIESGQNSLTQSGNTRTVGISPLAL